MNCEEVRILLDQYIDDDLSETEMRALMDHVEACEECAREMEAAVLLKDTLAHIDDDVQVPLQAQAAWRSAVRAEAKKRNNRKWMRVAYAAAAVVVLLVGGSFARREAPEVKPQVMTLAAGAPAAVNELIARDGLMETEVAAYPSGEDYAVWKKISSDNPARDRERLKMLAAEYNAAFTEQSADICRIVLPEEYLDDFMNAASPIGKEISLEMMCDDTKQDYVLIFQFCEE